jgi:tripartite-type tricarboxylate transporter receptor subunit TctC
VVSSRYCFYGPPGLPKDIVKKLEETFKKTMDTEEFKKVAKTFDINISFLNSEEMDKYHRDLSAKIRKTLIRSAAPNPDF